MPRTGQHRSPQRKAVSTNLSHTTINNKVLPIDKGTLVSSKEQNCLSLLDSFTKATRWEMNLAAVTLGRIVTKPVLKEGCASSLLNRDIIA